jgi:hypothetical protein
VPHEIGHCGSDMEWFPSPPPVAFDCMLLQIKWLKGGAAPPARKMTSRGRDASGHVAVPQGRYGSASFQWSAFLNGAKHAG